MLSSPRARLVLLAFGMVIVFGTVSAILLRMLPQRTATDYLVIGTFATMITLAVLFAVLIATWVKNPDVFFRRRSRGASGASANSRGSDPDQSSTSRSSTLS